MEITMSQNQFLTILITINGNSVKFDHMCFKICFHHHIAQIISVKFNRIESYQL